MNLTTFRYILFPVILAGIAAVSVDDKQEAAAAEKQTEQAWAAQEAHKPDEAAEHYREAVQIYKRLAEKTPRDLGAAVALSSAHHAFGEFLYNQGQHGPAMEQLQNALKIIELVPAEPGTSADVERSLSMLHHRIGEIQFAQGDIAASIASSNQSLAAAERRLKLEPEDVEAQRQVATRLNATGNVALKLKRPEEALSKFKASARILTRITKKHPDATTSLGELANAFNGLAETHSAEGRVAAALLHFEQALEINLRLLEGSRNRAATKYNLAIAHTSIAKLSSDLKKTDHALMHFEKAAALLRELAIILPNMASINESLGRVTFEIGEIQFTRGQRTDAFKTLQAARGILQAEVDSGKSSRYTQMNLINCCERLANLYRVLIQDSEALALYRRNVELALRIVQGAPNDPEAITTLVGTKYALAFVLMEGTEPDVKEAAKIIADGLARLRTFEKGSEATPKHKLLESDLLEMQAKIPWKPIGK